VLFDEIKGVFLTDEETSPSLEEAREKATNTLERILRARLVNSLCNVPTRILVREDWHDLREHPQPKLFQVFIDNNSDCRIVGVFRKGELVPLLFQYRSACLGEWYNYPVEIGSPIEEALVWLCFHAYRREISKNEGEENE